LDGTVPNGQEPEGAARLLTQDVTRRGRRHPLTREDEDAAFALVLESRKRIRIGTRQTLTACDPLCDAPPLSRRRHWPPGMHALERFVHRADRAGETVLLNDHSGLLLSAESAA
jgi:hypothetical protein